MNTAIINYINKETKNRDKRAYMSLLYINKYILKDTIIKDNKVKDIHLLTNKNWLEILNIKTEFPMRDIESIKTFINNKIKVFSKMENGDLYIASMKEHFENIGLYKVLADNDTNKFIKFLGTQSFSIDDIFDIYTQVNAPDRQLNDFFTPYDISNLCAELAIHSIDNDKKTIKIYDCACGTGNMLYSTYKKILSKHKDKEILVFGNDISSMYSSFSLSMFSLFNVNKSFFENKDAIIENVFNGIEFDIVVGNPPFGKLNVNSEKHLDAIRNRKKIKIEKNKIEEKVA